MSKRHGDGEFRLGIYCFSKVMYAEVREVRLGAIVMECRAKDADENIKFFDFQE